MISFDVGTLLPALAPVVGAVVVLVVDLFDPRGRRIHYAVAFIALVFGMLGTAGPLGSTTGDAVRTLCVPAGTTCFYTGTALTAALQLATLLAAVVTLLLAWPTERPGQAARTHETAVTVALLLAATGGAVGVAAARDLGSWLVALELATLPVVALTALPGTRRAVAGAIQLLTTSLVSFAMLTLAAACWYAATGSPTFTTAATLSATSTPQRALLALAVVLVLGGIGFKLSLVPFHAWTPAAYAGAPLPVTVFLAGVSKVAALAALLVVVSAVTVLGQSALVVVAVLAIASMTLGNLVALRQDDAVRLLAWSTIAQAGWVVLPLLTVSAVGTRASAGYLLTYLVATVVAFTVVVVTVRTARGRDLQAYRGMFRTHPWAAGALLLALTSLAGLPPGLFGLIGKVLALRPVLAEGWWVVGVLAAGNAVLGVAVYLRWARFLLQSDGSPSSASEEGGGERGGDPGAAVTTRVRLHPSHAVALAIGSAALVIGSVQPQWLLGLLG
ncbi:MAG: NADH/ubiquinone/plastoquinone [Actinomycetota bacterium]|nr:NADH/ubiquinone/plastoquinone [Actinomycetota bacterium]